MKPVQLRCLGLLLWRVAGLQALRRGLPLYFGLIVLATVVLNDNGLEPKTVVAASTSSSGTLLLAYAIWIVASYNTMRTLFHTEQATFVRWLPASGHAVAALLWSMAIALQLPWVVLWGVGAGWVSGMGAGCAALGLTFTFFGGRRPLRRWLAGLAILLSLLWLPSAGGWGSSLLCGVSLVASLHNAWSVWSWPPTKRAANNSLKHVRSPLLGITAAQLLLCYRGVKTQFLWGNDCALAALPIAASGLDGRWQTHHERASMPVAFVSLAIVVMSLTLTRAVLRQEREVAWLYAAAGTSSVARRLGNQLAITLPVVVVSLVYCTLVGVVAELPWLEWTWMALQAVSIGGVVAAFCYHLSRGLLRQTARDARHLLVLGIASMVFAIFVPIYWSQATWHLALPLSLGLTSFVFLPVDRRSAFLGSPS